ncbi:LolA family protein [Massilibacteroides vaginae]|uniref:LolA family protein n=1 Tax=Massilibacteroides vaginae TaxID=1673718 RepID=UPI00111C2BB8|nr:outer membrane lipoprotein carrier protein LolA [Massilibacteroides vaginae]
MKQLFIFFLSLFCVSSLSAQLTPLRDIAVFQEKLKQQAADITSIESDFVQEKYLSVFEDKIESTGRFYYRKENKIRMDYISPISYEITINEGKLRMVTEGKPQVVDLGSNKMMNGMKTMISACMIGDLKGVEQEYKLSYFENPQHYVVKIQPLSQNVRAYIYEITISFNRSNFAVSTLKLSETEKDYTEFHFKNQRYNTLTTDEKFLIR